MCSKPVLKFSNELKMLTKLSAYHYLGLYMMRGVFWHVEGHGIIGMAFDDAGKHRGECGIQFLNSVLPEGKKLRSYKVVGKNKIIFDPNEEQSLRFFPEISEYMLLKLEVEEMWGHTNHNAVIFCEKSGGLNSACIFVINEKGDGQKIPISA